MEEFTSPKTQTKTPRLYHFDGQTKTQILQDFSGSIDLESAIVSSVSDPYYGGRLARASAEAIGHDLGVWLSSFHNSPAGAEILSSEGDNVAMRQFKVDVTHGKFIQVLENFPDILKDQLEVLESVKTAAFEDANRPTSVQEQGWDLIHGDFWSGK